MTGCWGQDWASYQSATPDTTGLSFFFTKVSEGLGYVNPDFPSQYAHGIAAGLTGGRYHYPHMGNSVTAEGDFFLGHADVQPGDLVVLDWEGYDAASQGVSHARQLAYKDAWLTYVKGRLPHNAVGVYMNVDYLDNVDATGFHGDFLWIATAGKPAGQPGISAPWLFHQYSAATVDHDFCRLDPAALRAFAHSFEASPPVPPVNTQKEIEMILTAVDRKTVPSGTGWPGIFLLGGDGRMSHVTSTADLTAYRAAGLPLVTVSYAEYLTRVTTLNPATAKLSSAADYTPEDADTALGLTPVTGV